MLLYIESSVITQIPKVFEAKEIFWMFKMFQSSDSFLLLMFTGAELENV